MTSSIGLFLHFCVMRREPCASECDCGRELCAAFRRSVSVQRGVVLLHCRDRSVQTVHVSGVSSLTAMSVSLARTP